MVPAVTEVWRPQPAHSNVQALVSSCQALPSPQPGQRNPSGQRPGHIPERPMVIKQKRQPTATLQYAQKSPIMATYFRDTTLSIPNRLRDADAQGNPNDLSDKPSTEPGQLQG